MLLITPGERVDVIVTPTGPKGGTLTLTAELYNRGYGSVEYRVPEDVLTIAFSEEPPLPKQKLPALHRDIVAPSLDGATPVNIILTLPAAGSAEKPEFRINGVPFWKAAPFLAKVRRDADLDGEERHEVGAPDASPRFLLPAAGRAGCQPIQPMAWKDTLNVPIDGTIRFVVAFDERPGMWMFHCHILDHADGGLMGHVHLRPGSSE